MAVLTGRITPCLWFDDQAEQAANHYVSIFEDSRILAVTHYGAGGPRPEGMVMTVELELAGQQMIALNGGPEFTFDEAISFQVSCDSQEEVDFYYDRLVEGGEESMCGWLKDRFGLSWQIVPTAFEDLFKDPAQSQRAQRAITAMLGMKKLDLAALLAAADST